MAEPAASEEAPPVPALPAEHAVECQDAANHTMHATSTSEGDLGSCASGDDVSAADDDQWEAAGEGGCVQLTAGRKAQNGMSALIASPSC